MILRMPRGSSTGRPDHAAQTGGPEARTTIVESADQIAGLCSAARSEGRFAFDTEFVMEDRYEPEVCLVQVGLGAEVFLIDPFLGLDLEPVWRLVADEGVETVVHAGQEDLALCVQHTGKLPRHVFDVQIAAGFVGHDYPLSLQKLVQSLLHIRLHKTKTLTDWRRRPLTAAQLRYAAEDVAHLLALRRKIGERLERRGRAGWAAEEFRRFEDLALYGRVEEEKLRRLKGTAGMNGRQLASVRAMMHWRDGLAKQLNRPARVVLKDHLLVEIAKLGLTAADEIRDLRGLNLSDKNVRMLGQVVAEACALPPEHWPEASVRESEPPREEALIQVCTAVLRSYCLDAGLAYGLVATKQMIRELIRFRSGGGKGDEHAVELLTGWRAGTVGALLDQILSGAQAVRVVRAAEGLSIKVAAM